MSLRLVTVTCSVVAASLLTGLTAPVALATRAYVEPAVAPVADAPVSGAPHYARPPAGRRAPAPAPTEPDEPVMDRAHVRAALQARRAANRAAFEAYAKAGVYPSNTYEPGARNVWRDRDGHLCAAATVISRSGATELVGRVAEQNNFIKLADVQQGPLEDWILTSGFTQEEMVRIQRPFMGVAKKPSPRPVEDPFSDDAPAVDPDLRRTETARLQKLYRTIDAELIRDERASLDKATDRVMKHAGLAWQLVDSAS